MSLMRSELLLLEHTPCSYETEHGNEPYVLLASVALRHQQRP